MNLNSISDLLTPERREQGLQVLKSVIAASAAWWLSVSFLGTEYPFLGPWVALLTIDATTYRTLSRGIQSESRRIARELGYRTADELLSTLGAVPGTASGANAPETNLVMTPGGDRDQR